MPVDWPLVGRERERALLTEAIARQTDGGLVLVAGEAGVGKTALVEAVLATAGAPVLRGGGSESGAVPYGPLRAALRDHMRSVPDAVKELLTGGPETGLPELAAAPPAAVEDTGLVIRAAVERLAQLRPVLVFLDDLQWADAATLDVLAGWVPPPGVPLLVIGAYRSDELARPHPLRALRSRLRRSPGGSGRLLQLDPLGLDDGAHIVRRVLGDAAAPDVVATVYRRARGLPFFLEELAAAVATAGADVSGMTASDAVPETVRDAVLARIGRLSPGARTAAVVAAVAGSTVRIDMLIALTAEESVDELIEAGLLMEHGEEATAAFRHALVREALYAATPWAQRRRHHAAVARAMTDRGLPAAIVAAHWSAAGVPARARPQWLAAAEAACAVHAYRDAKDAVDRALASWPPGEDEEARLRAVDRLGECAERCGQIAAAARAWEEVAAAYRSAADHQNLARTQRRLAGAYELASDWPRALTARSLAAESFTRTGRLDEAATERLAAAEHLEAAGDPAGALHLVREAWADLEALGDASSRGAGPAGLRARAMGIEGHVLAALGDGDSGVELTRQALDLALDAGLDSVAAEVYALHAYALELATRYPAGLKTLTEAHVYCRNRGLDAEAHVCLACLTPALRHTGQWDRVLEVGRQVLASDGAPEVARMVAAAEMGLVLVNRGKAAQARRHLARAAALARVDEVFGLEIESSWGLARADELDGDEAGAADRLRELTARCLHLDERHYSVAALRWSATFFARRGLRGELGSCTDALARIAAATGTAEATGALAHALGEGALLEGDPRRAADQFERTLQLLGHQSLPPETAETQLRCGPALAAAGDREKAEDRLVAAYHTARALKARPLAAAALQELTALGADAERRLGRRASPTGNETGLTSREQEVLRLVADGLTNREIARELFLSPRTVDMHVRNLLGKLGCHTRTEAVRRARELSLLEAAAG